MARFRWPGCTPSRTQRGVNAGLVYNCLKKKENFLGIDDIALVTDCKSRARVTLLRVLNQPPALMAPLGHTSAFSGSRLMHSSTGGVIKGQYGAELAGSCKKQGL